MKASERTFEEGEFVSVLRPRKKNKLLNEWQRPFIISEQLTPVTYKIDMGTTEKRQSFLFKWYEEVVFTCTSCFVVPRELIRLPFPRFGKVEQRHTYTLASPARTAGSPQE